MKLFYHKVILQILHKYLHFIYVYFSIRLYADLKKECVLHILFKKVKIAIKVIKRYKGKLKWVSKVKMIGW